MLTTPQVTITSPLWCQNVTLICKWADILAPNRRFHWTWACIWLYGAISVISIYIHRKSWLVAGLHISIRILKIFTNTHTVPESIGKDCYRENVSILIVKIQAYWPLCCTRCQHTETDKKFFISYVLATHLSTFPVLT